MDGGVCVCVGGGGLGMTIIEKFVKNLIVFYTSAGPSCSPGDHLQLIR